MRRVSEDQDIRERVSENLIIGYSQSDVLIIRDSQSGHLDTLMSLINALTPLQIKQLYNENSTVRFGPSSGSP